MEPLKRSPLWYTTAEQAGCILMAYNNTHSCIHYISSVISSISADRLWLYGEFEAFIVTLSSSTYKIWHFVVFLVLS